MDQETRSELQGRLRSIEGHVRGVARMVEQDAECMDILHQFIALRGAIDRAAARLLRAHLHGCLSRRLTEQGPQAYEEVLREVSALLLGRPGRHAYGPKTQDTRNLSQEVKGP